MLTHGSLFSGIGGFDLAAEWAGWENIFHCEINPFGQQVLKYYWPNSISYHDITKTDFSIHRGTIDVLTGGFPCQPYSAAGKRLGKEDERHLWPEMLRAIREIQPSWVVGENVRGLTNWNGGLVFNEVQADLEAEGYEVLPFLLPASGVNAPHERYRIWFVAYAGLFGQEKRQFEPVGFEQLCKEQSSTNSNNAGSIYNLRIDGNRTEENEGWPKQPQSEFRTNGNNGNATYPECEGFQESKQSEQSQQLFNAERNDLQDVANTLRNGSQGSIYTGKDSTEGWENENRYPKERLYFNRDGIQFDNFPTQSPVCSRNDGFSPELVGITVSKHRNESIKAYGNAIVPQVVFQIFKSINHYEQTNL